MGEGKLNGSRPLPLLVCGRGPSKVLPPGSDVGGARVSEPFLGACGQSWCMLALRSAPRCASGGRACRVQVCTHPLQCPAHTCALWPERWQVVQLL